MTEKNVTLRDLRRKGAISEGTRKAFDRKLARGELTFSEVAQIYGYLQIDLQRAFVAVVVLRDPMAYFERNTEFIAQFAEAVSKAMHEQISASSGDFGPIRLSLVYAHSAKLTRQLIEGQERALQRGEEAYLADMERLIGKQSLQ